MKRLKNLLIECYNNKEASISFEMLFMMTTIFTVYHSKHSLDTIFDKLMKFPSTNYYIVNILNYIINKI